MRTSFGHALRTRTAPGRIPSALAAAFRRRLSAWFRRAGRDLPWRRTNDPYAILVSEAMLQQTQVGRVLEFYDRFLERFPTLERLAAAKPARVMDAWAGLGYYARARNLHALAREVVVGDGSSDSARRPMRAGDGAVLPADPAELRRLPGIGAYTAGAVASFAYRRRAALVDTNVARVLARAFAPRLDSRRPRDLGKLWAIAKEILPRTGNATWTHNQALMELGALICTARVKRCRQCPVRALCLSREENGVDGGR